MEKTLENLSILEIEQMYESKIAETARILVAYNKKLAELTSSQHYLPEILTVKQVADYLQLTTVRVYQLIKDGKLKKGTVANEAIRIRRKDLENYINKCFEFKNTSHFAETVRIISDSEKFKL